MKSVILHCDTYRKPTTIKLSPCTVTVHFLLYFRLLYDIVYYGTLFVVILFVISKALLIICFACKLIAIIFYLITYLLIWLLVN